MWGAAPPGALRGQAPDSGNPERPALGCPQGRRPEPFAPHSPVPDVRRASPLGKATPKVPSGRHSCPLRPERGPEWGAGAPGCEQGSRCGGGRGRGVVTQRASLTRTRSRRGSRALNDLHGGHPADCAPACASGRPLVSVPLPTPLTPCSPGDVAPTCLDPVSHRPARTQLSAGDACVAAALLSVTE